MLLKLTGQMKEIEIINKPHEIRVNTQNGKSILHCVRCGAVFGQWESNAQVNELKQQRCGAVLEEQKKYCVTYEIPLLEVSKNYYCYAKSEQQAKEKCLKHLQRKTEAEIYICGCYAE